MNMRTPLIAGSNRSSTRNGGSGRSSSAAFVQQLGRINRMFNGDDDDDDSEDESDDNLS